MLTGTAKDAVLYVPGINAENQESFLEQITQKLEHMGVATDSLGLWKDSESLSKLNIEKIAGEINRATESLSEKHRKVIGLGKSFGGGMLLATNAARFDALILFAPAIVVDESGGNLEDNWERPLSQIGSVLDISISPAHLSSIKVPVYVIHGEKDVVIQSRNSQELCALLPHAHLQMLPGLGHSPEGPEQTDMLLNAIASVIDTFLSTF